MQTAKDYLHVFLDMGDALLNSGAEIFRVEDTLNSNGLCLWCYSDECFCDHIQYCHYDGISGRRSAYTDSPGTGRWRK